VIDVETVEEEEERQYEEDTNGILQASRQELHTERMAAVATNQPTNQPTNP